VKSRRAAIGVVIVALWAAGLVMMLRRSASRSEEQQLAEVALTVQPATFYYLVELDGKPIGSASSEIDTTTKHLVSEEYIVGEFSSPSGSGSERTSARWRTSLTRGFRFEKTWIEVLRPSRRFSFSATLEDTTLVVESAGQGTAAPPARMTVTPPMFTPALAPVAFMLGGPREIGRTQTMSVFDPISRRVLRPELRIHAESLFTVVDSAARNASGDWIVAHQDTVRAWRLGGAPGSVSAWVDAEGRVVTAELINGLSLTRTAFEIAYRTSQKR